MKNKYLIIVFTLLFISCSNFFGEEIARLSFDKVSARDVTYVKEVSLDLEKGDEISFWSKMDFKHEGNIEIRYNILISKNDEKIKVLEYDPREKNVTIGEIKTQLNGMTKWSFTGKNGEFKIDESAKYTFKAILLTSTNKTFVFDEADLILKK